MSSVLPSMKFSVVPHHIKFLLRCGELPRTLKIQIRSALPWASLSCPCSFRGCPSLQCRAAVPYGSHACLVGPKAVPCFTPGLFSQLSGSWSVKASIKHIWYGSSVRIVELCVGCSDKERQRMWGKKYAEEVKELYFSAPGACFNILAKWSNRKEPFKPLASSVKMGSPEFVMSGSR